MDNDDMDDDINDENIEELIGKIDSKENIKPNFPMIDDDDDDDDDDIEENYLQKFDENTQKNIISEFHPELQSHNSDEIEILSKVVRDANGVVIDPLHKTLPFITRYEKARILGERAKQINAGAKPMVVVDDNVIDGYLIALKEFEEKKIPFIIKRPLPNGGVEYWKFKDLEVIS
jgi:DNA-directed RNA polymerase I, II, and III subunit RPABC2